MKKLKSKRFKNILCSYTVMDNSIKACIDVTFSKKPAMYSALYRTATETVPKGFIALKDTFWPKDKRTLTVKFLGGDPKIHEKVKQYANVWTEYGDLKFEFISSGNADIRVSFISGRGSYSAVGTDTLGRVDQNLETMNYGWLTPASTESQFAEVILHEFGHVCGLTHEHENPAGGIKWNKEQVYKDLSGPPNNWDKDKIDHNMFSKYEEDMLLYSHFDPKSIMLYPIPAEWTLDGKAINEWGNHELSENDKAFMGEAYPK